MKESDASFFAQLGRRMVELRKQAGLTQSQLGDLIQIKQQAVAAYECGKRRLPVSLVPVWARALGVTIEDFLGESNGKGRPGPTPRLLRQIEQVSRLPRSKQHFVSEFLDTVLQQDQSARPSPS